MTGELRRLSDRLERKKGERDFLLRQLNDLRGREEEHRKQRKVLEEAGVIIQEVSRLTQREVEFHISDLVSHGLAAVFDNPYRYELRYTVRRDKTEADQFWKIGDECYQPNGGGVRDVTAFALQMAGLTLSVLQRRDVRPVLFLDEPFKSLKPSSLQRRAGRMVKELSGTLGLQIVMVTHDTALSGQTDKTYRVQKNERGTSNAARTN